MAFWYVLFGDSAIAPKWEIVKAIKKYVHFNKNEKIKNYRKAKQLLSTGQALLALESLGTLQSLP